jgi:Tfp pilus assembly protein PilN
MRRIDIDLALPSVRRSLRRVPAPVWLLLIAGTTLCLSAAWAWQRQDSALAGLRADLADAQRRLASRQARTAPVQRPAVPEARVLAVKALVDQINRPWTGLLDALENADTPTVALLELSPLPRSHAVKGVAEARNSAAMLAYLQRLGDESVLDGVRLVRHEHTDQDSSQPVRFEFEAIWREGRP